MEFSYTSYTVPFTVSYTALYMAPYTWRTKFRIKSTLRIRNVIRNVYEVFFSSSTTFLSMHTTTGKDCVWYVSFEAKINMTRSLKIIILVMVSLFLFPVKWGLTSMSLL